MKDFDGWLQDLCGEPLPGGLSAAAVASAMGAALVAKAVRITLQRQDVAEADREAMQAVLDLAGEYQRSLIHLAGADECAFRSVLECQQGRDGSLVADRAWLQATEVPMELAEVCHLILGRLPGALGLCWPAVKPDLEIGMWLLQTGRRAGLLVADHNLRVCDRDGSKALRARADALRQEL